MKYIYTQFVYSSCYKKRRGKPNYGADRIARVNVRSHTQKIKKKQRKSKFGINEAVVAEIKKKESKQDAHPKVIAPSTNLELQKFKRGGSGAKAPKRVALVSAPTTTAAPTAFSSSSKGTPRVKTMERMWNKLFEKQDASRRRLTNRDRRAMWNLKKATGYF